MGGSLVGVTRKGKQGRKVNGLELLLLIRPPTRRATSCIQLVSKIFSFSFFFMEMGSNGPITFHLSIAAWQAVAKILLSPYSTLSIGFLPARMDSAPTARATC